MWSTMRKFQALIFHPSLTQPDQPFYSSWHTFAEFLGSRKKNECSSQGVPKRAWDGVCSTVRGSKLLSNWQGSNSDFPERREDVILGLSHSGDKFVTFFCVFPQGVNCSKSQVTHRPLVLLFCFSIKIAFGMSHCKIGFFRWSRLKTTPITPSHLTLRLECASQQFTLWLNQEYGLWIFRILMSRIAQCVAGFGVGPPM